jgi:hypothetical protein
MSQQRTFLAPGSSTSSGPTWLTRLPVKKPPFARHCVEYLYHAMGPDAHAARAAAFKQKAVPRTVLCWKPSHARFRA